MMEKGIKGGIGYSIYQHAKVNNKCMKNYDKNKELTCIHCLDVNNFCGWAMSLKLQVNNFE